MNRLHISLITAFLSLGFLLLTLAVRGQATVVSGRITEAATGEPIPFASVVFKGTTTGITSDEEGKFRLQTTRRVDSLIVSFVGYHTQTKSVMQGVEQEMDFEMEVNAFALMGITVMPEEDLIDLMMNWIRKNRDINDARNQLEHYQHKTYSKIQMDAHNVSSKSFDRKLMKPFEFVEEYIDTSEYTSKSYLPVLISETRSEQYFRKSPKQEKEIIEAAKVSGIENESITQFLGSIYQRVNVYDNYIFIFDRNFVSPIASFGDWFYKYELIDTVLLDNRVCFQIRFEPKRRQETLFRGELFIHDSSFAVKRVVMWMDEEVNLNFISNVMISQEYRLYKGKYWMVSRDFIMADFNPLKGQKNSLGLTGRRTSFNSVYVFDRPMEDAFYNEAAEVVVEGKARDRTDEYWQEVRPEELSTQESGIYEMVDSIKNLPAFNLYFNTLYAVTRGYYKLNKIELGPWWKAASYNTIEGFRLRVGGRTTKEFHDRLRLEGHLAYGFKDKRFKYGAGVMYLFSKAPRRALELSFKDGLEQLGQSTNAFAEDNIFAALFRRNPANTLTFTREYAVAYEHDWVPGFSTTFRYLHRQLFPLGNTRFIIYGNNEIPVLKRSIISGEIQFMARWAHGEKYLYNNFERTNTTTPYPVIELLYGYGMPGFLGAEYEYHRLQFRLKDWFNLFTFGWSKYVVEMGKIWGTLPYPLLKLHEGNETFIYFENAYNLMNYYEFISDTYVSALYTHHFNGLIFDKIPLMRKLKWRSVVHGRGVMGTITDENKSYSEFPVISGSLAKPYFEAGVGIENIFKVLRVDGIWRLSHLDHPNADKFRIYVSLQISF